MSDKAIDQSLTISIEKGLINNEKERTMHFVREIIIEKKLGGAISLPDGYGKEEFTNAYI